MDFFEIISVLHEQIKKYQNKLMFFIKLHLIFLLIINY